MEPDDWRSHLRVYKKTSQPSYDHVRSFLFNLTKWLHKNVWMPELILEKDVGQKRSSSLLYFWVFSLLFHLFGLYLFVLSVVKKLLEALFIPCLFCSTRKLSIYNKRKTQKSSCRCCQYTVVLVGYAWNMTSAVNQLSRELAIICTNKPIIQLKRSYMI